MIVIPVPLFALFVLLEAAALAIAVYLTFPDFFARLKPAKAKAPVPEQWIIIAGADGALSAWPFNKSVPVNCTVHAPGPYTSDEIAAMRGN